MGFSNGPVHHYGGPKLQKSIQVNDSINKYAIKYTKDENMKKIGTIDWSFWSVQGFKKIASLALMKDLTKCPVYNANWLVYTSQVIGY